MKLSTLLTYITTQDNEFFYYKTAKAFCYGVLPIHIDDQGRYFTILVKGKRKLSFPKGKKEYKEHPIECATRETREETGLVVGRDYKFIRTRRMLYDNTLTNQVATQYFPVLVFDKKELASEDETEIYHVGWYSEEDIQKLTPEDICDVRKYMILNFIREHRQHTH